MNRKYYKITKLPGVKSQLEKDNVSKTRNEFMYKPGKSSKKNKDRKVIILESLKKGQFYYFEETKSKLKQVVKKTKPVKLESEQASSLYYQW